jgi:hypothetical protein
MPNSMPTPRMDRLVPIDICELHWRRDGAWDSVPSVIETRRYKSVSPGTGREWSLVAEETRACNKDYESAALTIELRALLKNAAISGKPRSAELSKCRDFHFPVRVRLSASERNAS